MIEFDINKIDSYDTFTRRGNPVRIICQDAKGDSPIVVLESYNDIEKLFSVDRSGRYRLDHNKSNLDLVMKHK